MAKAGEISAQALGTFVYQPGLTKQRRLSRWLHIVRAQQNTGEHGICLLYK